MTMKLLGSDVVKDEKKRSEEERANRNADLTKEENRLIGSINALREEERTTRERWERERSEKEKELRETKTTLEIEVEGLEKRKKIALEPADKAIAEANEIKASNEKEHDDLATLRTELEAKQEEITEGLEAVSDRQQELDEFEASLNTRENGIKQAEEETARSTKALTVRWSEFHLAVADQNKRVEEREKKVEEREKSATAKEEANNNFKESLDKEKEGLKEERRAIADQRATLQRAWDELETKKQKHG